MQVNYQLTLEDFYQGYLAWRNRRKWRLWVRWAAYLIVGAAVLLSLVGLLFARTETATIDRFALGFGAVWFAWTLLAPRFSVRRQFKNSPVAKSPITLDASEEGLRFQSQHSDAKVAWSAYVSWGESKSVFVIMPQPRIYVTIPKRAFADEQVSEFREILRRNILPAKSK